MSSEFSIIERYFTHLSEQVPNQGDLIEVGIGDDGAVITPPGENLVVVTDTSISGVHFPKQTAAFDIAWKSLAVNLSDLAAMGATPSFFSLALSLPDELNTELWLADFASGLKTLANQYSISLIGGDTTKSDILSITITAHGWVKQNKAILRSGAKESDLIYVSGSIGDGGVGLKKLDCSEGFESCIEKLNKPMPRVLLGQKLQGIATSAIDISDGLLADVKHILDASNLSAKINYDTLPFSKQVKSFMKEATEQLEPVSPIFPLICGDDYEICFTINQDKVKQIEKIEALLDLKLTCIGQVESGEKGKVRLSSDEKYLQDSINTFHREGFKHFDEQ
jgi:thiamine-monophosphate kinase